MRYLPISLTLLRLFLGPVALFLAMMNGPRWLFAPILIIATLSDIFDGVLARRLGVATPWLRRFDSITDVIFYLFILAAAWRLRQDLLVQNWPWLAIILASHIAVISFSFAKFGKYPAAHSYLAKFYGLCLLFVLIDLLVFDAGRPAIIFLAVVALIANLEVLAIHALMPEAPMDVKSVFKLPVTGK